MACDYSKYNHLDDFEARVAKYNPDTCPAGVTGYEQYYRDMMGFWRELYAPPEEEVEGCEYDPDTRWNVNIKENQDLLPFWFDFLDTGELMQFSTRLIGDRIKVVSDDKVNSVYYRYTPAIIFTDDQTAEGASTAFTGYRHFSLPNSSQMFAKSAQGKSAKDVIDNLLYQHGYCSSSITINCVPIYYLQPNTRIRIEDEESGIRGDYIINRLSIPLTYNGTMNINATMAPQRLL